jgi:uncharacterized membrane protein YgaE (UPF0421/DUF939 family)
LRALLAGLAITVVTLAATAAVVTGVATAVAAAVTGVAAAVIASIVAGVAVFTTPGVAVTIVVTVAVVTTATTVTIVTTVAVVFTVTGVTVVAGVRSTVATTVTRLIGLAAAVIFVVAGEWAEAQQACREKSCEVLHVSDSWFASRVVSNSSPRPNEALSRLHAQTRKHNGTFDSLRVNAHVRNREWLLVCFFLQAVLQ